MKRRLAKMEKNYEKKKVAEWNARRQLEQNKYNKRASRIYAGYWSGGSTRRSRKRGLTRKIGPLKKGELKQFGYKVKLPSAERHTALKRAVRKYGSLSVWKKINVLYVYSKYSNPTLHRIYGADRNWIRHTYGLKSK
jgi:hypothetical protein